MFIFRRGTSGEGIGTKFKRRDKCLKLCSEYAYDIPSLQQLLSNLTIFDQVCASLSYMYTPKCMFVLLHVGYERTLPKWQLYLKITVMILPLKITHFCWSNCFTSDVLLWWSWNTQLDPKLRNTNLVSLLVLINFEVFKLKDFLLYFFFGNIPPKWRLSLKIYSLLPLCAIHYFKNMGLTNSQRTRHCCMILFSFIHSPVDHWCTYWRQKPL